MERDAIVASQDSAHPLANATLTIAPDLLTPESFARSLVGNRAFPGRGGQAARQICKKGLRASGEQHTRRGPPSL